MGPPNEGSMQLFERALDPQKILLNLVSSNLIRIYPSALISVCVTNLILDRSNIQLSTHSYRARPNRDINMISTFWIEDLDSCSVGTL